MEFLNLPALYALGALPLLLLPYLVRRKPRRRIFSSLLLLEAFATRPDRRFFGRLRLPLLFFLQLIVLALLVGASADPIWREDSGRRLALILDNSASMQVLENGKRRFDRAKEDALRALRSAAAGTRVDVYLTVPWAGVVGRDLTVREALALVENTRTYDLGDAVSDEGSLLDRLGREGTYGRILFFTDRPVRGGGQAIQSFTLGQPQGNVAITGFDVDRGGLGSAGPSARVEVSNFSAAEQRVEVVLLGEGTRLGTRRKRVPAGQSTVFEFGDFPAVAYYEARVAVEGPQTDPLALDNRRFAVALSTGTSSILGVSPRPKALESLRAVPGVQIDAMGPEGYQAATDQKYGLEIFHFAAPRELPQNNALFILPPEDNPLVRLGTPQADVGITSWTEVHPLTRYVNVSMLRPHYTRPLEAKVPAHSVLDGPSGSLALVFERDGFRYAVLGFDPLPFLGRRNLPMSIFTLNVLGWLRDGGAAVNQATGVPLNLASEVRRQALTPQRTDAAAGTTAGEEPPVLYQGVYERFRSGKRELVAVNFDAPRESDLLNPDAVVLARMTAEADLVRGARLLWPYIIAISLLLLAVEWLLQRPNLRTADPGPSGLSK